MWLPRAQVLGWLILLTLASLTGCSDASNARTAGEPTETGSTADVRPPLDGAGLFAERCAACHENVELKRAAPLASLSALGPAQVMFAMTNGLMKTEAAGLSTGQMLEITTFIAGERETYLPKPAAFCEHKAIDPEPRFPRWGVDERSSWTVPDSASSIDATNVADLQLAWAFGLPDVANARSQPVLTEDTLFIAAASGHLFALDRETGCIRWHRPLEAPPRTALTLGRIGDTQVLFFGDLAAEVNAVAATNGVTLWRQNAAIAEHSMLTGAQIQHGDLLIVPVSLYEVGLAADPDYECCISHGGVLALDATTGERLWTTHLTPPATEQGRTDAGTPAWGPSGVPVWSTPTIDPKRGLVYVGTGQNASLPTTEYSDSVVALDIESGEVAWHFQAIAGDAYNMACDQSPPGANCPKWRGPDHDIGASVVMVTAENGQDRLIVGQKSGDVYALDPEAGGARLWQKRVGAGSPLGGIHWGLAVSDGVIYAPVSDPPYPIPGYRPAPGLYALSVEDGSRQWSAPITRDCDTNLFEYFGRTTLYPACSFYFGLSAPPLVVNDLVFAGALDGRLRAFARSNGAVLWQTETARAFETINGVPAHGGSIDVAGIQAVDDMLYLQSGYGQFGELPGNALLAYRLVRRTLTANSPQEHP